jgi:exosome complex component RRP42
MSLENYEYVKEIAAEAIRLDERKPIEGRKLTIKNGVINHSDGSAYLELGGTKVLAGVKVLPGEPFPDRADEGGLIVNFEASELCTNYPSDRIMYSVEIARVTDRGIRESNLIDLKKLVIEVGKKVLFVYIDVFALNNEGNLLDACNIAALSALLDARYKIEGQEQKLPLPLDFNKLAVSHTFAKVNNSIFYDPSAVEENVASARLTLGVGEKINSIQKGGSGFFTPEEVDFCTGKAFELKDATKDLLMKQTKK